MNDLRYAFRQLLKNPGFTIVAVFPHGLGDGFVACFLGAQNEITQSKL